MKKLSLILLLSISFYCSGQKIGAIELNDCTGVSSTQGKPTINLRELFFKSANGWEAIIHTNYKFKKKTNLHKVKYYYNSKGKFKPVVGKMSNRRFRNFWTSSLFKIPQKNYGLEELPEWIYTTDGSCARSVRIITNNKLKETETKLGKTNLNIKEKENIVNLIKKAASKCTKSSTSLNKVLTTESIIDSCLLSKENIKIAQADFYNLTGNCFSLRGSAYGSNILHCIIRPNQKIETLLNGMYLVDYSDYDQDGKEEYLFLISFPNNYGYVLYYNDFKEKVLNMNNWH